MVSSPQELLGKSIGHHCLNKLIGVGGTGAVYLGSSEDGHQAAVKVLIPPFLADTEVIEESRKRFQREVSILSQLDHPHILPIQAFGDDAATGFSYMVMPYKSGGTLATQIKAGRLELEKVLKYVQQIAQALDYAHAQGIIHRDIKPANVLLDEEDQVYLADFSIAKLYDMTITTITNTHHMLGTPAYMAPEQVANKTVSPATDVYGLAVLTYQLMTGRLPFENSALLALIQQIMHDPVPSPRDLRPDLPLSASDVLLQALAKEPEARFSSAGAFAQELEQGLQGSLVTLPSIKGEDEQENNHPVENSVHIAGKADDIDETYRREQDLAHAGVEPTLPTPPMTPQPTVKLEPLSISVESEAAVVLVEDQQKSIVPVDGQVQASEADLLSPVDATIYPLPIIPDTADDVAASEPLTPTQLPLLHLPDLFDQVEKTRVTSHLTARQYFGRFPHLGVLSKKWLLVALACLLIVASSIGIFFGAGQIDRLHALSLQATANAQNIALVEHANATSTADAMALQQSTNDATSTAIAQQQMAIQATQTALAIQVQAKGTAQAQAHATATTQAQDDAAYAAAQQSANATATAQQNANATATAQQNANATATAQQNADATAAAQQNADATAAAQQDADATATAVQQANSDATATAVAQAPVALQIYTATIANPVPVQGTCGTTVWLHYAITFTLSASTNGGIIDITIYLNGKPGYFYATIQPGQTSVTAHWTYTTTLSSTDPSVVPVYGITTRPNSVGTNTVQQSLSCE